MKKIAFLQALVLVILLAGSWMLLLVRHSSRPSIEDATPGSETIPVEATPTDEEQPKPGEQAKASGSMANRNPEVVPAAWVDWITYLRTQSGPKQMRDALERLRVSIFSMDTNEAVDNLFDLIVSNVNLPTGLTFAVGEGGRLLGASDLRTILLDWLGQLDPGRAADFARSALTETGTSMGPDTYVVHMRNFAWGTHLADPEARAFLSDNLNRLLETREWIDDPARSVAEAFDFIVYLEDSSQVQILSSFMEPGRSPALGHAGSLVIERLIDQQPVQTASALIETIGHGGIAPASRAGFMARLDPSDPAQGQLLKAYLKGPGLSQTEANVFLSYLPNLNKSLSHNLVSPEISITGIDEHNKRLEAALEAVRDWESDPDLDHLLDGLEAVGARIRAQLAGEPVP